MTRKLLIRFDDICPTMDWELWEKAIEILEKYNIKPLIGVIPDCKDPDLLINEPRSDFWDYIKELQNMGYSIAMHGLYHKFDNKCRGMVTARLDTEFAGHPYQVQYEKIKLGKKILYSHGIETDIFFAPAHSYDRNTLKALVANGFRYMSDGKSSKPINFSGVIAVPCRASGVPKIGKKGYYTAVFHAHEWKRPDKAYGYKQLVELCKKYSSDIISFEEYKKRKCGIKMVQFIDEKFFQIMQLQVRPILSRLKNQIIFKSKKNK